MASTDNGLPGGYVWQIEAGDPALYNDARLTAKLYTFPAQERLLRVVADAGEAAVPRYGDVPLNDETAMLVLLKAGALAPDSINWANAATDRFIREQSFQARTDWKRVDPWGLWFAANPSNNPDLVAKFRDWTLRRAASLPDQVVLRQSGLSPSPNGFRALGQERTYTTDYNKAAVEKLRERGSGLANVLNYDYRIQANLGSMIVAAPLANGAYIVPPAQQNDGRAPALETVLQLGPVETVGQIKLLNVTPLSASLSLGDQVVSRVNFMSPAEQAQAASAMAQAAANAKEASKQAIAEAAKATQETKAQAAAEQEAARVAADASVRTVTAAYLAGTISGPDVLGLRLGMSLEEADDTVRKAISVGWVLVNPDRLENFDAIDHLRIYVSTDKTENVALVLPPEDQPQHVIGVERIVHVAPTVPDTGVAQLLREKYGAPTSTDERGRSWTWGNTNLPRGSCTVVQAVAGDLQVLSGPPVQSPQTLLRFPNLTLRTPVGGPNVKDLSIWANCRPIVSVQRGDDYIYTKLWDMRALVSVASSTARAGSAAEGEGAKPAIKF